MDKKQQSQNVQALVLGAVVAVMFLPFGMEAVIGDIYNKAEKVRADIHPDTENKQKKSQDQMIGEEYMRHLRAHR